MPGQCSQLPVHTEAIFFLCGKSGYLPTNPAKQNLEKTSFEINLAEHSTAIH